jgi:hypothetical protein
MPTEDELFDGFADFAFRLEMLPEYVVPEEAEDFDRFRRGEPLPLDSNQAWVDYIGAAVAHGKTIQRVRCARTPHVPYVRYELEWGFLYSATAGEDIRISTEADAFLSRLGDFWLFDDHDVVLLHYTDDGRYLGSTVVTDNDTLSTAREIRAQALEMSTPLRAYLAKARDPRWDDPAM